MKSVTATALAIHLDTTRETIGTYVATGVIERRRDGFYDLDACRKRVLRHLRARASGRTGHGGDADLSRARASLAKAQTESAIIKNQLAKGELVAVAAVGRIVMAEYAEIRGLFLGAPGANAHALAFAAQRAASLEEATRAIMEMLTDIISEILSALSDPAKIAAQAGNKLNCGNGHGTPHQTLGSN